MERKAKEGRREEKEGRMGGKQKVRKMLIKKKKNVRCRGKEMGEIV